MSDTFEVRVPDIGDFEDVEVIEVHVAPGDSIAAEDPLITLESDKAAMDVPSPAAGTLTTVEVAVGDKVSQGSAIVTIEPSEKAQPAGDTVIQPPQAEAAPAAATGARSSDVDSSTQLVVMGSGPGGYTAAFRAADLGLEVTLIERYPALGGVCLNVGCIPSKALLHAAKVVDEAESMAEHGISFGTPRIDAVKLRGWKDQIVGRLTGGLTTLAKQRKVRVIQGTARFLDPHSLEIEHEGERQTLGFEQCIIAVGSQSAKLPGLPDDPRVLDSTSALELDHLPERMLVVGGGIIGLEMACVYDALGVKISVVELTDGLMPGVDRDVLKPLQRRIQKRYEQIMLGIRVTGMEALDEGIRVSFEGDKAPEPQLYGAVLVAVGRSANGNRIAADLAGVEVGERGLIAVDRQMRTNVAHVFAIGDVVGEPMLAHKATHEAKVAAEVAAGQKRAFDARVIPSVAYTDPEVAWVGVTETEAKVDQLNYGKAVFPWAASGRSLGIGRSEGQTKLLFDKSDDRLIGAGIVGPHAGDLIAEVALAIEMGSDAGDVALTIHPHPTLSETLAMAAEAYEGTITDLYMPNR